MAAVAAAVAGIGLCCCCNVVTLELLLAADGECGVLLTAAQFAGVAAFGLLQNVEWRRWGLGLRARAVPLLHYAAMVALFLLGSLLNNVAFQFRISLPLHSLFRSGSLVANVALGLLLGKRYARSELFSVAAVTAGILLATFASLEPQTVRESTEGMEGWEESEGTEAREETVGVAALARQTVGIGILTAALFLSTGLSLYQERVFHSYRRSPRENLLYTHLLALPLFIFLAPQLWETAVRWGGEEAMSDLLFGLPRRPLLLLVNVLTQIGCISFVFRLINLTSALTLQLTLSLRKFVSLIFSIAYFGHAVTGQHWAGVALVFGGSLLYSWSKSRPTQTTTEKAKET